MELKKLASQTAIYGLSSMVGRFLNFLLVPLYTSRFIPEEYGVVTVLYAMVGFVAVLLTYGMETAFFNFSRKEHEPGKVYNTALIAVGATSAFFLCVGLMFSKDISQGIAYPNHPEYVRYFLIILAFDAITALPFAWLRKKNKAMRFAGLKMLNIAVNIGLNLYFIKFGYDQFAKGNVIAGFNPDLGVSYIFIANLVASAITLVLLIPEFRVSKERFDKVLFKKMLYYAWPLVIVGFAGMINELLDRVLLKYLLPENSADYNIGVYGAFYKLSIIITLFVQAFRFAAEPFFFDKAAEKDSPLLYARIMNYFVAVCGFIFLATMLFVNDISSLLIRRAEYYQHPDAMHLVPILLMANVFLGMYYNLSIWYKLSEKTLLGSTVAVGGALVTIVLNIVLVPKIGIMGAAWTTLLVYGGMTVAAFAMGTKHYPVPYNVIRILFYLTLPLLLWKSHEIVFSNNHNWLFYASALMFLFSYMVLVFLLENRRRINS